MNLNILIFCCLFYFVITIFAKNHEEIHVRAKRALYDKKGNPTEELKLFNESSKLLDDKLGGSRQKQLLEVSERFKKERYIKNGEFPNTKPGDDKSYTAYVKNLGDELKNMPPEDKKKLEAKVNAIIKGREDDIERHKNDVGPGAEHKREKHIKVLGVWDGLLSKLTGTPPKAHNPPR